MGGLYTCLACLCPLLIPGAELSPLAHVARRPRHVSQRRRGGAWRSGDIADGAAELADGLSQAEVQRIGDQGMADRHLLQVGQRLDQGGKIGAG